MRGLHGKAWRVLACTWLLALVGCGPITFTVGGRPADQQLQATVVEPDEQMFGPRVAIIDVSGRLLSTNRPRLIGQGENPVSLLHEKLQRAKQNDRIKAIILRLNTPGGTVTASDVMYRNVQRFKRETGKPVVALMMDVTASGGYYLACAADEIVTYPTSVTGSIGVLVQTVSLKPALTRLGVQTEAITSGKNKAAGSPLTTLSDDQRQIFQTMVQDFYQRFERVVRDARPAISDTQLKRVTDGRVVSGERAVELHLADQAGDLYDAFDRAKALANVPSADLVVYHRRLKYVGSPYAASPAPTPSTQTQINLAQVNLSGDMPGASPARFYYLWQPTLQQTGKDQ
jgi:protease-4